MRSQQTELLVAMLETSPGSGAFEVDDRMRVEEVSLASDEIISTARFSVRLDNEFDTAAARARYSPDLRVAVRTESGAAGDVRVLFDGHPPVQEAKWRGGPGRADESFGFTATHVYERLSRDRDAWVYGRQMRSAEIEDGLAVDAGTWSNRSVWVTALPCLFNPDGKPNCAPTPLTVTTPDHSTRTIHIFTHDDDPNGIEWTYLNALRYLVWFYNPRGGPVDEGNVFDVTDPSIDTMAGSSGPVPSALLRRLFAPCLSLNCEATNLVESLALLSEATGTHVSVDTTPVGPGVKSSLRVWSIGDGPKKSLHLVRGGRYPDGQPRYDGSLLSASDVFAANEIAEADITWDYARIVNAPIVVGHVKTYEMTFPLVPGWPPTANLDNVEAPDREGAKQLSLTPDQVVSFGEAADDTEWFRKFHRDGTEHAAHQLVARRWVLNEDGRFDGESYNRNAPFDDYQPFDFSRVADATVLQRGRWSRRSRRLFPTITRTEQGADFGVFVEISFDSGTTWHRPQGPVTIVSDPTGVVFESSNPLSIAPPGVDPLAQNLWYAIIDQTFRVRVTALIESDDRLIAGPRPRDGETPTLQMTSRVVYRPDDFRFESRSGTTNALSSINPDGTDIETDDSKAIQSFARALTGAGQDRRVDASPVIPWLDTLYVIGDEIERIRGRGVSFVTRDDGVARGPVVMGKRYQLSQGRWRTTLSLRHGDREIG